MHGCTSRRFGDPTSGSVLCRQITLLLFFSFSQGSEKEKIQRCFRYRLNYHDDFLPHKPKAGWTNLRIWEINFPCCQHAKAMKTRFHSLSGYHKCALCAPQNQPEMLQFAILPLFSVRAAKGLLLLVSQIHSPLFSISFSILLQISPTPLLPVLNCAFSLSSVTRPLTRLSSDLL